VARRNFSLLKETVSHPSLRFKKIARFWAVRTGPHHRTLAVEVGEDLIWVWIGAHDDYERMIEQQG
jgi:hypothetical protein